MTWPSRPARLSINLAPERALQLRRRMAHGVRSRLLHDLVSQICRAGPNSVVVLAIMHDGAGRVWQWQVQRLDLAPRQEPSKSKFEGKE